MSLSSEEKLRRLQKALDYGGNTHRIEDVVAMVRGGRAQFWDARDAAVVTEVLEFPLRKIVNFWLLSGCIKDIVALEPEICRWALAQDCTGATATGRSGWGRVGAPLGWKPWWPTFHKALVS